MNLQLTTTLCASICLCLFLSVTPLNGQTPQNNGSFVDRNKDGVNDLFADANGDGVNDVTKEPYPHHFQFSDSDGDGINDVWKDADGDGVNDLLGKYLAGTSRWVDTDGDGLADQQRTSMRGKELMKHVLDENGDRKNDITGLGFTGRDLMGYRFGNVDEERGVQDGAFCDADGDGMNDRFMNHKRSQMFKSMGRDVFIDSDGDGVADNRSLNRIRGRGQKKGNR